MKILTDKQTILDLNEEELKLYMVMCLYRNDGVSFDLEVLAEQCAKSEKQIRRILNGLIAKNYVSIVKNKRNVRFVLAKETQQIDMIEKVS